MCSLLSSSDCIQHERTDIVELKISVRDTTRMWSVRFSNESKFTSQKVILVESSPKEKKCMDITFISPTWQRNLCLWGSRTLY
ncbi:hypothetical protein TNCV_3887681 [Trichonephila clavipes]|nr:hypothetical protein TNCV_3887681 [Trichonephila clavipes]